jgi:gliding motility associated protien GldN
MLMAIGNGMPVFSKSETGDIRPTFAFANMQIGPDALSLLDAERATNYDQDDEENRAFQRVLRPDSLTGNLVVNASSFSGYAKNQLKYLIKEVIFFDKHYCRLYSEIEAIAPLHAENGDAELKDMTATESIWNQILFWVRYNDFRPYMTQKYVSPRDNDSKRVTFDDFFRLKLYSSYILGINNVYGRMVTEIAENYEDIQREQKKIEVDLLNIEQDLWEY